MTLAFAMMYMLPIFILSGKGRPAYAIAVSCSVTAHHWPAEGAPLLIPRIGGLTKSQPRMGTIAKRRSIRALASAKEHRAVLSGFVLHGRKFAAFVAAIAEWLVFRPTTGAPPIGFAVLDFRGEGTALGNFGIGHDISCLIGGGCMIDYMRPDG